MERESETYADEFGPRAIRTGFVLAALALIALPGCASRSEWNRYNSGFARVFTPQVPEFLCGPAGALLTNAPGFSARATFESRTPASPKGIETTEGELLACGTRLLFAPRSSDPPSKEFQAGGFSFIWDVGSGSGYVLSEALQGYATVSSSSSVAGLAVEPGTPRGEESAVVTLSDGSRWSFLLQRSTEAKTIPAQIASVTNAPAFTLKLARLRLEAPPANLFAPPQGFAKYPSPEALADELAARRNGVRRGAWSEAGRIYQANPPSR